MVESTGGAVRAGAPWDCAVGNCLAEAAEDSGGDGQPRGAGVGRIIPGKNPLRLSIVKVLNT